ncbi:MAG: GNAT family N-acetyltransferase [Planctomycetaceae bacterium]
MNSAATIQIHRFTPEEWRIYKQLRLSALKEDPDAFGSRWEKWVLEPDSWWESQTLRAHDTLQNLIRAEVNNAPAGLACGVIEEEDLHKAHVYQFWVDPCYRSQGVGKRMLDEIISWARQKNADSLELHVTCGDRPAARLYARAGFRVTGEPEPIREGSIILEQTMELRLS